MTEWMRALNAAERGDAGYVAQALRAHPHLINDIGDGSTATGRSTLLTIAARRGHLKLARMLLRMGADVNATDDWDDAPLHHAVRLSYEKMLALLLSHKADIRQRGKDKKTPLMLACEAGYLRPVKTLWKDLNTQDLEQRDGQGKRVLHYAAANGHGEVVSFLVLRGAQPNSKSNSDETPLMVAIDKGHTGVVKSLLRHLNGRGLDDKDKHCKTLLHRAVQARQAELVTLLISRGVLALCKDNQGRTPLLLAVQLQLEAGHDMMDIVNQLLERMAGTGMESKDNAGNTVLHLAAKQGSLEMVSLLLTHGASPLTWNDDGNTPLMLAINNGHVDVAKRLVTHMGGRGLEQIDRRERSAVHLAAHGGNLEMVSLLLSAGAKAVAVQDRDGETPLLVAAKQGRVGIVMLLAQHMGGRGLEAKDTMGRTALHLMVQDGSVETVAVLLAAGADPLTKDSLGEAVLMLAVNKKRWDMVGRAG